MKEQLFSTILNKVIEDLLHNTIFYVPKEIILDVVLEKLKGEIDDNFFDKLSLLDINEGMALITNEDALETNDRLLEKRAILEKNIFNLLENNYNFTPAILQLIINKYYDQLLFQFVISEWLTNNLKRFNKQEIHISIIGAFKLQYENFNTHLIDFQSYFGSIIDKDKEHNFSLENMVMEHIPNLVSRYCQITDANAKNTNEDIKPERDSSQQREKIQQLEKKSIIKKKQRPIISDIALEKMVLKNVFNVETN